MTRQWQGYIGSRYYRGKLIPQRLQNLIIREYCSKHQAEFVLSATEYNIEESFLMLKSLIGYSEKLDGVVFYSMDLLPSIPRPWLTEFLRRNTEVHFALENIAVRNEDDLELIDNIFLVKNIAKNDLDMMGDF